MLKDGNLERAECVFPEERAESPQGAEPVIVSLFSGAGGLDLGFKQAGFKIAVAVDSSLAAIKTHKRNFPRTLSVADDLLKLGAEGVLALVLSKVSVGSRIGVIGGPPCQGFSRANNGSGPNDPRNALTSLYIEIVRKLCTTFRVEFVVFENVLGLRDRKNSHAYQTLRNSIIRSGFHLSEHELCAIDFGVPQIRRRVILAGLKTTNTKLALRHRHGGPRTVRDAIQGLPRPTYFKRDISMDEINHHPNHWTMQPRSSRFDDPARTSPGDRSFKRLAWDEPSPTVAYGNREIHVHPNGRRRLSIYEAMLLQGFPDDFVLEGNLSEQVTQVSNAVPPPLGRSIALAIRRSMKDAE